MNISDLNVAEKLLYQIAMMRYWFERSDEGVCFCKFCGGTNVSSDKKTKYIRHKVGCLWIEARMFFKLPLKNIL
jgi:hypothetical protein